MKNGLDLQTSGFMFESPWNLGCVREKLSSPVVKTIACAIKKISENIV